jgi:hypothetical protein
MKSANEGRFLWPYFPVWVKVSGDFYNGLRCNVDFSGQETVLYIKAY